jgi:hypothetical protein
MIAVTSDAILRSVSPRRAGWTSIPPGRGDDLARAELHAHDDAGSDRRVGRDPPAASAGKRLGSRSLALRQTTAIRQSHLGLALHATSGSRTMYVSGNSGVNA